MTAIVSFPSPLRHELTQAQWEEVLTWCAEQQASDIVLCPDDKIWMQKDGIWHAVTDTCITDAEIQYMVNVTSGQSNRAGYVRAGHSLDYAFGLRVPGQRGVRQRFRVNATSSNKGIYVVLRILPRDIPVLEDMQLPDDLAENLYPDAGLVVISGVMGSGKSTLLAAILHRALLAGSPARQILTLEDPIEFDFSAIPCQERSAPITQSAIGVDVEDWAGGVRTLTRRKGEIVMVGECRDRETISSLLSTVEQGVAAYTTVHAQDVAQTMTRIIHLFRKEERDSAMAVLFASIRLIIHQRLVPRNAGTGKPGRIALREYLVCDRDIRMRLYDLEAARLIEGVRHLVATCGHSLLQDARDKYGRGLIDGDVLRCIVHEQEGKSPVAGHGQSSVQGSSRGIVPGKNQGPCRTPGHGSGTSPSRPDARPSARPSGMFPAMYSDRPSSAASGRPPSVTSARLSGMVPSGKVPSGQPAQGASFPGAAHSAAQHPGASHSVPPVSGPSHSGPSLSWLSRPGAILQRPDAMATKGKAAPEASSRTTLPGPWQSPDQVSAQNPDQPRARAIIRAAVPIHISFRAQGAGANS